MEKQRFENEQGIAAIADAANRNNYKPAWAGFEWREGGDYISVQQPVVNYVLSLAWYFRWFKKRRAKRVQSF